MRYDPEHHHRRAMRLAGYDYAQEGAYYVTVCTHDRACFLSEIVDDQIQLTPIGSIAERYWLSMPVHHAVELDEFVIMPNHLHGIVVLLQKQAKSLFNLMRGFKTFSTKTINVLRDARGTPIWQTRYYDHVVRDQADLDRIRAYIADNPRNWLTDEHYSA